MTFKQRWQDSFVVTTNMTREVEKIMAAWCLRSCNGQWDRVRLNQTYVEFEFENHNDGKKFIEVAAAQRDFAELDTDPIPFAVGTEAHALVLVKRAHALAAVIRKHPTATR